MSNPKSKTSTGRLPNPLEYLDPAIIQIVDLRRAWPLFAGLAWVGLASAGQEPSPRPTYWTDVAPVLKSDCLVCHSGIDAKADLDLTKIDAVKTLVKPGDPKGSLLIQRLRGMDGMSTMPLGFRPLPEERIAKIEAWIMAGASFGGEPPRHWAYAPIRVVKPKISSRWVRNPIDSYVLERLQKEGMQPSPEAAKETLARRVYLDLTGLPPTVAQLDEYLSDKSKNAYEKLVDKLLASPHYGEHIARYWLDLARYADTNGYEADRTRQAHLYRDWLIGALNVNMPFDQFTRDQLAGDLIPNAEKNQLVATGFHRNSMFNEEGGTDPEETMYETVVDRVNTTATVWMASTLACSRCHDHKFDPFTQRDYYGLFAYFGNNEFEVSGDRSVGQQRYLEPSIKLLSDAQEAEIKEIDAKVEVISKSLRNLDGTKEMAALKSCDWRVLKPDEWRCADTTLTLQADHSLLASGKNPPNTTYRVMLTLPKGTTGIAIRALPDDTFIQKGPGRASSGNFVLTGLRLDQAGKAVPMQSASADFVQGGYSVSSVAFGGGPGWAVYPQAGREHTAAFGLMKPIEGQVEVSLEFNDPTWKEHAIGRFALLATSDPIPHVTPTEMKPEGRADFFRSIWPKTAGLSRERDLLKFKRQQLESQAPAAMVLRDRKANRTAQIRERGMFAAKKETVEAGSPAFLSFGIRGAETSRLDLASWLTSAKNPLTARVQVNRMWEMHFGRGIVETSEDFGTQGTAPTHPGLLDHLADAFIKSKWNVKAMHRLIVTSATYRQASTYRAEDPQNALLSRGPRFRMDAEMVRDTLLTASGLINPKIGGPSVMPYQPDGVWNSPYNGERWMVAKDAEQYRRGVYTFWKRTAAYPAFATMDAGSRELCEPRRSRTNTPLQALALLNDRVTMDAARALGKLLKAKGIDHGFRACLSRSPSPEERARTETLRSSLQKRYEADFDSAKKVGRTAEEAAWTMTASVLLNLDETISKE